MCWYILCLSGNILSQGVWVALWSLINGSREKLLWGIKGQGLRIWWILLDLKDIFKLKWPVVHFFHSYFWQKMGNDLRSCVRLATRLSSLSFFNVQIPFNIEWRKLYGNRSFFLVYIASELFSEHIFTSTIRYQRKVPELLFSRRKCIFICFPLSKCESTGIFSREAKQWWPLLILGSKGQSSRS